MVNGLEFDQSWSAASYLETLSLAKKPVLLLNPIVSFSASGISRSALVAIRSC
jgi:hypothetical protein